ncbi:MAG: leucine-rich repeat protein [Porcipelethomonas sp.]
MKKHITKIFSLALAASLFTSVSLNSASRILNTDKSIFISVEAVDSDLGEDVQEGKTEEGLTYLYNSEKVVITGYEGTSSDLVIPKEIDGKPVTDITEKAFFMNSILKNVVINAEITVIPLQCFYGCNLESVALPETLKVIESQAFTYCRFKAIDLPDKLEEIQDYAFSESDLEYVDIPDSVTDLKNGSFFSCVNLKSAKLPDNLSTVPYELFENCIALEEVILPENATVIEDNVFTMCRALRSIVFPDRINTVNSNAFEDCISLSAVYIPASVTFLAENLFSDCYFLTIYGENNSYAQQYASDLQYEFVAGKENLNEKTILSGTADDFDYVNSDESAVVTGYHGSDPDVIIPEFLNELKVIRLSDSLFYQNQSIENVKIEAKIKTLPKNCFADCETLKSVELPEGLLKSERYAFRYCTTLNKVTLPDSLETIADESFQGCSSLESIVLPDNLKTIGACAFEGSGLKNVSVPEGITDIDVEVFANCEDLESVEIPNTVTRIYTKAFCNCNSLKQIIIPDSVVEIYNQAFESCDSLSEVYISDNTLYIQDDAFAACPILTIYGEENSTAQEYADKNGIPFVIGKENMSDVNLASGENELWRYLYTEDHMMLTEYLGSDTEIIVPAEVDGHHVTAMASEVFGNNRNMIRITIEAELKKLENNTFSSCEELQECNLPDSLQIIGYKAFSGCRSLKTIRIPDSVITMQNGAFTNCTNLKEVFLSSSLKEIGTDMFMTCRSLENIEIPSDITVIGINAFRECISLQEADLPDGLLSIEDGAFAECVSLKKFVIPDSVEYLGPCILSGCPLIDHIDIPTGIDNLSYTFSNCTGLKNIMIPDNVTIIGDYSFENCEKMTGIYIPETVNSIEEYAFENCYFLVISAPKDSYAINYAKENNIKYIEISENTGNEGFEAGLGADVIENLDDSQELPIFSNNGSAIFDADSVIEIKHRHGNKDISFSYNVVKNSKDETMSEAANEVIENGGKLLDFDLTDTDGNKIEFNSQENDGTVTITVPYTKPVSANEVWVYYIAPDGTKTDMNGVYNPSTKTITFTTTHFSYYSIESDGDVRPENIYDVNKDGFVNVYDVVALQQFLLKKSDDCVDLADINGDGFINVFDLIMLKHKILSM